MNFSLLSNMEEFLSSKYEASILIAEDSFVNQKLVENFFRKLGYKVDFANDGNEAIDLASKKNYDLIFMDIEMPELSGLEATDIILKDNRISKKPKIIAMTAHSNPDSTSLYQSVGMVDYLIKPISLKSLSDVIVKWMS